jgi:hypothetical protein
MGSRAPASGATPARKDGARVRRHVVLAVIGGVALLAAVPGAWTPRATAATVAAGTYRIFNAHDNGCLTSAHQNAYRAGDAVIDSALGDEVKLGACDGGWTIAASPQGATIAEQGTTDCLAPSPRQVFPPRIATVPCADTWPHEWTFAAAGHGALRISAVGKNNRCLSATHGRRGPVVLLPCAVGSEEKWTLTFVRLPAPQHRFMPESGA